MKFKYQFGRYRLSITELKTPKDGNYFRMTISYIKEDAKRVELRRKETETSGEAFRQGLECLQVEMKEDIRNERT